MDSVTACVTWGVDVDLASVFIVCIFGVDCFAAVAVAVLNTIDVFGFAVAAVVNKVDVANLVDGAVKTADIVVLAAIVV